MIIEVVGEVVGFKDVPWKKNEKEGVIHFVEFRSLLPFSALPQTVLIAREFELPLFLLGKTYRTFIFAVVDGSVVRVKAVGSPVQVVG